MTYAKTKKHSKNELTYNLYHLTWKHKSYETSLCTKVIKHNLYT